MRAAALKAKAWWYDVYGLQEWHCCVVCLSERPKSVSVCVCVIHVENGSRSMAEVERQRRVCWEFVECDDAFVKMFSSSSWWCFSQGWQSSVSAPIAGESLRNGVFNTALIIVALTHILLKSLEQKSPLNE